MSKSKFNKSNDISNQNENENKKKDSHNVLDLVLVDNISSEEIFDSSNCKS